MVLGKTLSGPIWPHNRVLSPPNSPDLLTTHFYYGFNNLLEMNQKIVSLFGGPNGVVRMTPATRIQIFNAATLMTPFQ